MIAYLDSSVVLRVVLGQPDQLREWKDVREPVTSAVAEVECLRTLDRLRLRDGLPAPDVARLREAVFALMQEIYVVEPTRPVLARASQPFPTALGTLDAVHLATALLWRENRAPDLVMATHDTALALAARACGLSVVGI